MGDDDRFGTRNRSAAGVSRLSADEIANRSFPSSRKGVAEAEVRAFLRRVADDVVAAQQRERELVAEVERLEAELRAPRKLGEEELIAQLGAETAAVLKSARDAADDVRRKADEYAASLKEESEGTANRLRRETDELVQRLVGEAEQQAADVTAAAERRAGELIDEAERSAALREEESMTSAAATLDAARSQGRQMVEEARLLRERILAELGRRRTNVTAQIDELRLGRDRILDAYRTVKKAYLEAIEALANLEAESTSSPVALDDAEIESLLSIAAVAFGGVERPEPAPIATASAGATDEAEGPRGEVGDLFARLRAEQAVLAEAARTEPAPDQPGDDQPGDDQPGVPDGAPGTPAAGAAPPTGPATAPDAGSELDGLIADAARRVKRVAQDEQNSLLDAVRRHKGPARSDEVLPPLAEQAAPWIDALRGALDEALATGRRAAGGDAAPTEAVPPGEWADELVMAMVASLRTGLVAAIDDPVTGSDPAGVVAERIGARYREWKTQRAEAEVGELVRAAHDRGRGTGTA